MNELMKVKTNDGKEIAVVDSREVAEMMGRTHTDIMKMIQGSGKNLGLVPVLEKGNFHVSDYFIESTYKVDGNNKTYKCYLVTKMGCEMLGNKQQGEKGVIFNALFNDRFKAMKCDDIKNDVKLVCETLKETHKRQELEFLDMLEQTLEPFNIQGVRQYQISDIGRKYRIDYYIPSLNIAIEYDENEHKGYSYDEHEGRQIEIEKEIRCRFIRVSNGNNHMYNVGQVIKEIFNLSEVA